VSQRLGRLGPVFALAALLGWTFRDVLAGAAFYERDVQLFWYARAESLIDILQCGALPLWDPYTSFGSPFLAWPSQLLYPFTALHLVLRPWRFYTLMVVVHSALGAGGMYRLSRASGTSRLAATVAALAFAVSGPVLSTVNLWNLVQSIAWLPWVGVGTLRLLRSPSWPNAVLFGTALALPMLIGSEVAFMGGALAVALLLAQTGLRPWHAAQRPLVTRFVGGVAFAIALSAGQALPSLEMARGSARATLSEEVRTHWSVHPAAALTLTLVPVVTRELPLRQDLAALEEWREPYLYSIHFGLPLLILATIGAVRGDSRARAVAALTVLGALLALGRFTPVLAVATVLFPPLRAVRYPVKATLLVALGIAFLAALGLDEWRAGRLSVPLRRTLGGGALLCAAAAAVGALTVPTWTPWFLDRTLASEVFGPLRAALGLAAAVAAGGAALLLAFHDRFAASTVLGALAVLDLSWAHDRLNKTGPPEMYRFVSPAAAAMRTEPLSRHMFHAGTAAARAVEGARAPDGIPRRVATALAYRSYVVPFVAASLRIPGSYEPDIDGVQPRPMAELYAALQRRLGTPDAARLLQVGAVRHVTTLSPGDLPGLRPVVTWASPYGTPVHLLRHPAALPRTYVAGGVRIAADDQLVKALLDPSFDPSHEIVLAEGSPLPSTGGAGTSRIAQLCGDRVRLEVEASVPGYAVLADMFDAGWRAQVDGADAPLLRANGVFRAVPVPPGRHVVEMRYRPRAVLLGIGSTAVAALMGIGVLVRGRR
jgi:hypothetical protein